MPGDISIHHPGMIHKSEANTSDQRRCGLSIRYMPSTTLCKDAEQPVLLLRGKAVPNINNYRSWPKYRKGFDFPFRGCEQWNAKRYVNPEDEAYFQRTDYDQMNAEIRKQLNEFVEVLGGR